jgi:hypothetical protein
MPDETHKRVNVYLEKVVHALFVEEIGEYHVSEFFRLVEEETLCAPDEDRDLALRLRARNAVERTKQKFFQQRKLLNDSETIKAEQDRKQAERQALIERETKAAIHKLKFSREWLRDKPHMSYESKRLALADEVSIACRMDLQWKDLYPVVAAAVYEEVQA